MARPLRIERPGAWYHVTARGNERRAIYRDDRDRQHFCDLLAETAESFCWKLHAYVLMENHFHLLVETPQPNLARAMQWLNVSYSVWFNRRRQRSGHLFQGRYKAIVVDPASWGLELSRYLHLNPVRVANQNLGKTARRHDHIGVTEKPEAAQIKARITNLRNYRWSSYRAYLGLSECPAWLTRDDLLQRGPTRETKNAAQTYRQYVESAVRQGLPESPWEKLTAQTILGSARFVQAIQRAASGNAREQTALRQLRRRPSLSQVIAAVEKVKAERWSQFRNRHGDWGRDMVLCVARKECGLKLAEIGAGVGGLDSLSAGMAIHRFKRRLAKNPALRAQLDLCLKAMQM